MFLFDADVWHVKNERFAVCFAQLVLQPDQCSPGASATSCPRLPFVLIGPQFERTVFHLSIWQQLSPDIKNRSSKERFEESPDDDSEDCLALTYQLLDYKKQLLRLKGQVCFSEHVIDKFISEHIATISQRDEGEYDFCYMEGIVALRDLKNNGVKPINANGNVFAAMEIEAKGRKKGSRLAK